MSYMKPFNLKIISILILVFAFSFMPNTLSTTAEIKSIMINADINVVDRVVVFSIDACRFDYLNKTSIPTFEWLISQGVKADYNLPSNPTLTAVNHVSIITGNHPEKHGIMGNTFYDWEDNKTYSLFSDSSDPYRDTNTGLHLLKSKPSVIHAEENEVKTAVFAWPYVDFGTFYNGESPTYVYDYDWFSSNTDRTDLAIANKVAKTIVDDPEIGLVFAWLPGTDSAGHYSTPDSGILEKTLQSVDNAIRRFCESLAKNDLLKNTVIILTSDHGMAPVHDSAYFLEDKPFFLNAVNKTGLTPYMAHDAPIEYLYFFDETNTTKVEEFADYLKGGEGIQAVFINEENDAIDLGLQERRMNISVWLEPGYSRNFGSTFYGMHGYLNSNTLMRGIFIVAGPGIRQGATISGIDIRSIAPTALSLLNLDDTFSCDGVALSEILGTRTEEFSYPDLYPPKIGNIEILPDNPKADEEITLKVQVDEYGSITLAEALIKTNVDTTGKTIVLEDLGSNNTFFGTIGPFSLNEEVNITITVEDSRGFLDIATYSFIISETSQTTKSSLAFLTLASTLVILPILRRKKH
ncbi:MAG: alkaline phosphatase family protein [Candidatus Heimdallarchaeaceae archaeon]